MPGRRVQDLTVSEYLTREVVWAAPDDDLGEVLGKMKKYDVHEIPVGRKGKLQGVVTLRELMKRHNVPPTTKLSSVLVKAPVVSPTATLPAAAEELITTGFRALPVVERKTLLGIISRTDLVRALVDAKALGGLAVRDFMTPNPQAVSEDDTIDRAVHVMQSLGERSLPVVDKNRRLKGVIGMKDVTDLFARPKMRQRYGERAGTETKVELQVKGAMHYPPVTMGAEGELAHAAELMLKNDVSSVIITEKDEPVGIVTKLDLMHFLAGLRPRDQLFVEISGLEDEPAETYDTIYSTVQKEMRRIAQLVTPKTLSLHVQKYKPNGDRWKYSIRCRFQTAHQMYYANHFDWDLHLALRDLLEILYKRIVKDKERMITERKLGRST
ncbi:MAG TPA: CBS domain-containing protein [Thermoplasmata archaeon]|nr:CBS domain-containing protein [Thermoplasmata archaeon]